MIKERHSVKEEFGGFVIRTGWSRNAATNSQAAPGSRAISTGGPRRQECKVRGGTGCVPDTNAVCQQGGEERGPIRRGGKGTWCHRVPQSGEVRWLWWRTGRGGRGRQDRCVSVGRRGQGSDALRGFDRGDHAPPPVCARHNVDYKRSSHEGSPRSSCEAERTRPKDGGLRCRSHGRIPFEPPSP